MPWSVYNSNGKLLQSLAIGDDSIVEGKLDVSNAPTNGYFLQAQSGEGGGLTWAAAGSNISCKAISFPNVQSLPSGGYEEVILNGTDAFDVTNMHSPSTNNTRITFATAGTYLLVGHVIFAASTGGIRNIEFMANGSTRFDQIQENTPHSSEEVKMVNTSIYTFAAADYVELRAKQNCGSNLNINTCELSAVKILG